jgi:hypothetical protein
VLQQTEEGKGMTGGFPVMIENMGYFARFPVGFRWISCFFLRLYCDILLWGGILEGKNGELRMEKREDPVHREHPIFLF